MNAFACNANAGYLAAHAALEQESARHIHMKIRVSIRGFRRVVTQERLPCVQRRVLQARVPVRSNSVERWFQWLGKSKRSIFIYGLDSCMRTCTVLYSYNS